MSDLTLTILILGAVAAGIGIALWWRARSRKQNVLQGLPVALPDRFPYIIERFGVPLIESVVPVPEEAVQAITEGIRTQIEKIDAARPWWENKKSPEDYNVALIEPTATNRDGSPALMIRGIQSAGTCIGVANDGHVPTVIILPHQAATDWGHLEYLKASARHESEHDREFSNDPAEFWAFLGANDVHPHFP
jgi:hypothetical protein